MVALRSTRQDRRLLIAVWVLTAVVLVLGGLSRSPILLVWGTVGLIAAIYLTRVHLRDTRAARQQPDADAAPAPAADEREIPGAAPGQAPDAAQTDTSGTSDVEESR